MPRKCSDCGSIVEERPEGREIEVQGPCGNCSSNLWNLWGLEKYTEDTEFFYTEDQEVIH